MRPTGSWGGAKQRLKGCAMCASILAFAEVWMRQMSQGVYKELKVQRDSSGIAFML